MDYASVVSSHWCSVDDLTTHPISDLLLDVVMVAW